MTTILIALFIIGYLAIAFEHPLKVDKTASALLLGMLMWCLYISWAPDLVPFGSGAKFDSYLADNPSIANGTLEQQSLSYVLNVDIVHHLGDIAQTLIFLIGAMTIVELIDVHGGFQVITDHITTRHKRTLLWTLTVVTFFLSAVLDNLTTTIVMLMLLRKIIDDKKERWLFASVIVLAANSGGAWSPIGDVTTIMLWVKGNVTLSALVSYVLLPSIVSVVVPVAVISGRMKGSLPDVKKVHQGPSDITRWERITIFVLGVTGLLLVPVFKSVLHLPPFVGILFVLGALWVFTECFYNAKMLEKAREHRLPQIIGRIDMPSILFFLGILMAVAVLQSTGILGAMAHYLDEKIHDIYIINLVLGFLSSVIDNVPMVAAAMGMYPVAEPEAIGYAANFVTDGHFWGLLSYCAGVGGSMLIIGSAAGVIAMGLEKIQFGWYMRNISWLAMLGYLCGAAVYVVEQMLF